MKSNVFIFSALLFITFITNCSHQKGSKKETEIDSSKLRGPYLGQKPPGIIPEIFAPGIISTEKFEGNIWFSKDGFTLVFYRWGGDESGIHLMEQKNGKWKKPRLFPHILPGYDGDFLFSPDGRKLVFSTQRPVSKNGAKLDFCYIYLMEKTGTSWGKPVKLDSPVNSGMHDSYPCLTKNYNLYFFSRRDEGYGKSDIYRSKLVDGKYSSVENSGKKINSADQDFDAFVAPGESYMIFCSDRPGGYGYADLYISFKKQDNAWTDPVNMGEEINSEGDEWTPFVTIDDKYLFFSSDKVGNREVYWVDAKIIEELKPDYLK